MRRESLRACCSARIRHKPSFAVALFPLFTIKWRTLMTTKTVDVLLVGAGAMSTTLGMMLKQLDPALKIGMVERLDHVARESTDGWNNAGTGHAAYCELNYTPQQADGSINTTKAFAINTSFEVSLQFWSYLVEQGKLPSPKEFINPTPHCSFVWARKTYPFCARATTH